MANLKELRYMDNAKSDNYYIQKIRKDLEFIVIHMRNVILASIMNITETTYND